MNALNVILPAPLIPNISSSSLGNSLANNNIPSITNTVTIENLLVPPVTNEKIPPSVLIVIIKLSANVTTKTLINKLAHVETHSFPQLAKVLFFCWGDSDKIIGIGAMICKKLNLTDLTAKSKQKPIIIQAKKPPTTVDIG